MHDCLSLREGGGFLSDGCGVGCEGCAKQGKDAFVWGYQEDSDRHGRTPWYSEKRIRLSCFEAG